MTDKDIVDTMIVTFLLISAFVIFLIVMLAIFI